MLNCGMNRCMCIEDTTIDGVNVGEIYQYIHMSEYETLPANAILSRNKNVSLSNGLIKN